MRKRRTCAAINEHKSNRNVQQQHDEANIGFKNIKNLNRMQQTSI